MDTGPVHRHLSRRERQIMDILFRLGRAPATVVREELPGTPSLSTVRTQLRILEKKGHVRHEEQGLRYVYRPVTTRRAARRSALRHLVGTFFDGSAEQAVAALLGGEAKRLTEPELERIARFVADAKAAQQGPGPSAGARRGKEPDGNGPSPDGGNRD
jgi:predicted transcriptional regulator